MERRDALKLIAASGVYAVWDLSCRKPGKESSSKPNIVFINIDDMGWRDAGFMGSQFYETPHMDALSRQGAVFSNGYASAANCAPSRACLMTGQWPQRHGIYTVDSSARGKNQDRKLIPTKNKTILADEHLIIPEVLKKNGYITCLAGKWHLNEDPKLRGFDVNIGGCRAGSPGSYFAPYPKVPLKAPEGKNLTDHIMEKTLTFLDSASNPFFLYYSPYAVHSPVQAIGSLMPKYENKPAWNEQSNKAYATMIENLDKNIGLLVSKLKEKGVFDNTLIIFTSDNGGHFGFTRQRPLRAGKGSYYEGGIRVPFFFVWKDKIPDNLKYDRPITNLDVFPTLMKAAGIESSEHKILDGENLLPLLMKGKKLAERPLFWHFPIYLQAYNVQNTESRDPLFRTRPGSVARSGDWKLHHYFEDNGLELYNLANDIGEQNNVAEIYPEKTHELYQLLDKWRTDTKAPVPGETNPDYSLK